MLLTGFSSLYLLTISMFGFVKSSISYCVLLVINCLCCATLLFLTGSTTWYSILLYLVYVGGIYILFIFMSLHLPNKMAKSTTEPLSWVMAYLLFWEVVINCMLPCPLISDFSFKFCSGQEGLVYFFLSLSLGVGFIMVSFMSSSKEMFIR